MIDYLKGQIIELTPTRMVMECYGVGYELNISLTTYSAYNGLAEGRIFTFEVIREDAHILYGFFSKEERELFVQLTSVSGVGPNTARMILSSLPPIELIEIIAGGDEATLTRVKGIGSKTAQRIIVDLKNKVRPIGVALPTSSARAQIADEAIAALIMLGFQKNPSQKAVDTLLKKDPSHTIEDLIKQALKML